MQKRRRNLWLLMPMVLGLLVAVGGLLLSVMYGIGAFYHPFADGATFAPVRIWIALAFVVVALLVLIVQSVWLSRMTWRISVASVLAGAACYGAALLIGFVLSPQPDAYVRYVVDQPYLVPRHYGPTGRSEPGPDAGLWAEICASSGQPIHAGPCRHEKGIALHHVIQLTPAALTDGFDVSYPLENSGIAFDGDRIAAFAPDQGIILWSHGDLDGFSIHDAHYLMDAARRLVLVARCQGGLVCTVRLKTPDGTLHFASSGAGRDPQKWLEDAEPVRQLVHSWRCLSPGCADEIRG